MRVTDTASFIEKSKATHGEKYDYSKSIYKKAGDKVEIICLIHGSFFQNPHNHVKGFGCSACSGTKKLNNDTFRDKAIIIHGNKYEYSNVNYINISTKVAITCKKHGDFNQTPNKHLMGRGCPVCAKESLGISLSISTDEFVSRSIEKHGNIYNYGKSVYKNNSTKVIIICRTHGEFEQRPSNHMKGDGCRKCGVIKSHKKQIKTVDQFIKDSINTHGDRYDYSRVIYKRNKEKVEIICKNHGSFMQDAIGHISGKGCQSCASESRTSFKRSVYVENCNKKYNGMANIYLIKCFNNSESFYKVGITCTKIDYRFKKSKMPYSYEVISTLCFTAEKAWDYEKDIHRSLNKFKYRPSINFGGSVKECFSELTQEVKDFFGAKS